MFGKFFAVKKAAPSSHFVRENIVKGYLVVDGKQIPTFNPGTLVFAEKVRVTFYNNFNNPIRITDMEMNGHSIFAYADVGMSYREKADYAVNVLKSSANQGLVAREVVHAVEQAILDMDALNEHMKAGRIVQLPGEMSEDFAWRG